MVTRRADVGVILSVDRTPPIGGVRGSRGYVVAAVDHAYESSGTSVPDGLKKCVACEVAEAPYLSSLVEPTAVTSRVQP